MTPERWKQVDQLLQGALGRDSAERDTFLAEACNGDDELRREVESLLGFHERAENFFEAPPAEMAADWLNAKESRAGQTIGHYHLIRRIGRGGIGEVYEATRSTWQFEQQVAIKIIKRGMDTDFVRDRFTRERRILARLEHPHIARLIDGGATEDGLPYLVMEFVEGHAISEYCEANQLSINERLKLFRQVCAAVQFAHQNLVVHRDIKPSNILIGKDGVPKLLDFGIAKMLNPDLLTLVDAETHTATEMRLMTPEYASPEQVHGKDITTASDIYSLGVVLYELLTGVRPHQFKTRSPFEIERAICDTETQKPSAAVSRLTNAPAKLRRQLAGDLDNIVLMAMRKEPERRYQSVQQFSEDIGRHLEGLPVIARQDTIGYRAGKFIRRHKLGVAATALVILSLLGGIAMANYQARRAERRFQQVRKLANTFLFDFHDQIRDLPGSTAAREMMIKTALEYLDSLAQEAEGDASLQLELALAYEKVGDVQGNPKLPNLGHAAQALDSYRRAVSLEERLIADDKLNLNLLRLLSRCYYKTGDLQSVTGDRDQSARSLKQGLSVAQSLYAAESENPENSFLLTSGYTYVGDLRYISGDAAGALENYRAGLKVAESLAVKSPGEQARRALASMLDRIGNALHARCDLAGALNSLRQAQAIREELSKSPQAVSSDRYNLRRTYQTIGDVLGSPLAFSFGDTAAALDHYRKSLAIAEDLAIADPKDANNRFDLSGSYRKLCSALRDADPSQSAALCEKSIVVMKSLLDSAPENLDFRRRQALNHLSLSYPLGELGDHVRAMKHLRLAMETQQEILAKAPTRTPVKQDLLASYNAIGDMQLKTRNTAGALENYRQALTLAEAISISNPSDPYSFRDLADCYERRGHLYVAMATNQKTPALERMTNWSEARAWFQKSLEIWDGWMKRAVSGAYDKTRREKAVRVIAQCDTELSRLTTASFR